MPYNVDVFQIFYFNMIIKCVWDSRNLTSE